ncbi:hypothetical protein THRCLA_03233 [Thraustotheca clavata]|uniref:BZIP domain-containing protein n=1 Tax=Thraustotheca clavata TaxID=74557 RepID=A0A1W0A2Y3_9STRA|nr:hypothetical protein THRCLA_03233 [Thraustotheca clavata]
MVQVNRDEQLDPEELQHRRRLQGRKSQKTFRERQKQEHKRIISTVQSLQSAIAQLEEKKAILARQAPLDLVLDVIPDFDGGLATKTVRQYIVLFKQGYNSSKIKMSAKQKSFLQNVANSDVQYNYGIGIDYILESWQRYTSSFVSVSLDIPDCVLIKTDAGAVVKGVVRSHLKISAKSLTTFFPNCPQHLKQKLNGQILTILSTMHWYFDENDRLVKLTGSANFACGLLDILHNIDDVANVLTGSILSSKVVPQPSKKMNLDYIT